jgi:hypothetical protein
VGLVCEPDNCDFETLSALLVYATAAFTGENTALRPEPGLAIIVIAPTRLPDPVHRPPF